MASLTPVTDELLHRMADAIVRAVAPERIVVLFGSHARGNPGPDSDVDFLVVESEPFGPGHTRQGEIQRIRRALWDYLVPVDILVYSRDEAEHWREATNHVIARSLREGKVLYARP